MFSLYSDPTGTTADLKRFISSVLYPWFWRSPDGEMLFITNEALNAFLPGSAGCHVCHKLNSEDTRFERNQACRDHDRLLEGFTSGNITFCFRPAFFLSLVVADGT